MSLKVLLIIVIGNLICKKPQCHNQSTRLKNENFTLFNANVVSGITLETQQRTRQDRHY